MNISHKEGNIKWNIFIKTIKFKFFQEFIVLHNLLFYNLLFIYSVFTKIYFYSQGLPVPVKSSEHQPWSNISLLLCWHFVSRMVIIIIIIIIIVVIIIIIIMACDVLVTTLIHYIISHRIFCYIALCFIALSYVIPCYVTLCDYIISHHIIS